MKAGAAIGIGLGLATLGVGGVLLYKHLNSTASAPPGTTPAGTNSQGVQQYVNQAGNIVNQAGQVASQAGQVANAAKSIIQSVSGQKLTSKPTSLPSDFNAKQYMINNPDVAAARDKAHPNGWTAEAHYLEYGWKEGRSWTAPLYGLGCGCNEPKLLSLNGVSTYNLLN